MLLCSCGSFAGQNFSSVESKSDPGRGSITLHEDSDIDENKGSSDADTLNDDDAARRSETAKQEEEADCPITYPTAWVICAMGSIPAGEAVRVLSLPEIEVEPRRGGVPLTADEREAEKRSWPVDEGAGDAIIEAGGEVMPVGPDLLLVNLPNIMPSAAYDVVYSYGATSNCGGIEIPGITGERIVGYAGGRQEDRYLAARQFAAPCAYRTALKAIGAAEALENCGYRLLVYDAYRPMSAQHRLSEAFEQAYNGNPAIREAVGGWSLGWYVASGASGHNYGTDLDVGVCDLDGNPIAMPSTFDAFDEGGHLTKAPMASENIGTESYCDAVSRNTACMKLHEAFTAAGFSELASEWWHFGDEETEARIRAVVGPEGLDFMAVL